MASKLPPAQRGLASVPDVDTGAGLAALMLAHQRALALALEGRAVAGSPLEELRRRRAVCRPGEGRGAS